jgi:hypothetical protein
MTPEGLKLSIELLSQKRKQKENENESGQQFISWCGKH